MIRWKEKQELFGFISLIISSILVIIQISTSYFMAIRYSNEFTDDVLQAFFDHRPLSYLNTISAILYAVFLIPAIVFFFLSIKNYLNDKQQKISLIPTISQILATILLIGLFVLQFYVVVKLSPDYVSASTPQKTLLMDNYDTIVFVSSIIEVIVYVFLLTLGLGFLGFILLRTLEFKGTISYVAIFIGICGLLKIGVFIPGGFGSVLDFIGQFGSILYFLWLGIVLFDLYKKKSDNIVPAKTEENW